MIMRNIEIRGTSKNLVARWSPLQLSSITNCWKEFHLNVAEFLELSLKTSPCMETSLVLCENQPFFLLYQNMVTLHYFLPYDEVLLCSLLDVCYHCLVFMDPVNGYSKSKLLVKEQVLLKSKISFSCVCLL